MRYNRSAGIRCARFMGKWGAAWFTVRVVVVKVGCNGCAGDREAGDELGRQGECCG